MSRTSKHIEACSPNSDRMLDSSVAGKEAGAGGRVVCSSCIHI